MVSLAAPSLSVSIVKVIDKALIIVERKEEYKQSYKFYKQLLNLYKAREISEEEVYKREEDFVNNLVINERVPERIQTDKGLVFVGQTTQKLFKENNIQWFTTENVEIKAAMKVKHKPKFQVGDKFRISIRKSTFRRGNQATFTEEIFVISEVLKTDPITYKIKDLHDEDAKGGEMCSLAYVCENLTPVLEYLGNDHPILFVDVRRIFLVCLDQMYDIVFREENDDLREEGLEALDEVLSILDNLV
ncbi:uncharacterized transposon-derived protein F54H12.3 [Trichonephila clavipes]|nr:uncharacterized transposon-derived protein F54H12.3 [Trichonephila clavipes]